MLPTTVVISHRIVRQVAPGREVMSIIQGNFERVSQAVDIYYKANSRYRKSALVLCMSALAKGLDPVKFEYHRDSRIGTLHCVDSQHLTPDGKPWPVVLDLKEVSG